MNKTLIAMVGLLAMGTLAWAGGGGEAGSASAAATAQAAESGGLWLYATPADYESATGNRITGYSEAPQLAAAVAAGELPPVAERLPVEPVVIQPAESIGRYGGTLRTGSIGIQIANYPADIVRLENVLSIQSDLKTPGPGIAKDLDLTNEGRDTTLHLREGMRWSDGEPFDANAFMFWYQDILLNDDITPNKGNTWAPGGNLVEVIKVDDTTVTFRFAATNPTIISSFITDRGVVPYAPRHYLEKWHIAYNEDAGKLAVEEGYEDWWQAFGFHLTSNHLIRDTERPMIQAWLLDEVDNAGNKYFVRNPYYWKVDTAGNQLPYIDELFKGLYEGGREVFDLKIAAGDFDVAARFLPLENLPIYKQGEEKGNFRTILSESGRTSECTVLINFTVDDPVKREVFADIRFRQALMLSIDRDELNDILFLGMGRPHQNAPHDSASFYEDWWGSYFIEYDTDRANALLDEAGLDQRDNDGWRLGPDGNPFEILLQTGPWEFYPRIAELLVDYWRQVGINATSNEVTAALIQQRARANEMDMTLIGFASVAELSVHRNPWMYRPAWAWGPTLWATWYRTDGEEGVEPWPEVQQMYELSHEWQRHAPGTEEYIRIAKEMTTIYIENLFVIPTVGYAPNPFVFNNDLKNTPQEGDPMIWDYTILLPYHGTHWYFDR